MADPEGFEPSIRVSRYTPLAGERFQPLSHRSRVSVERAGYEHLN